MTSPALLPFAHLLAATSAAEAEGDLLLAREFAARLLTRLRAEEARQGERGAATAAVPTLRVLQLQVQARLDGLAVRLATHMPKMVVAGSPASSPPSSASPSASPGGSPSVHASLLVAPVAGRALVPASALGTPIYDPPRLPKSSVTAAAAQAAAAHPSSSSSSSSFAPPRKPTMSRATQTDRPAAPVAGQKRPFSNGSHAAEQQTAGRRFQRRRSSRVLPQHNDGPSAPDFMSGTQKLAQDEAERGGGMRGHTGTRRPGLSRRRGGASEGNTSGYRAPFKSNGQRGGGMSNSNAPSFVKRAFDGPSSSNGGDDDVPDALKGCDPKFVEMISNEILSHNTGVTWQDIAGLEFAKKCVKEIVVWPMKRPDFFRGLRAPPKGVLLFGPPGTGKTMIGKAIASETGATFFSISAASLGSKWHGEGEKLVRTLFAVAAAHQPAIIFIDEIDSLLCQRSDNEFEGSRRMKTEFLIRLEGASTPENERVLVVGATNRPQELDEAARRRLVKRLYIPLPDEAARRSLITHLLRNETHALTPEQVEQIVARTRGYSGADLRALCTEAAFGPIRSVGDLDKVGGDTMRPIGYEDFAAALTQVRASVSQADLKHYIQWNSKFGSFPIKESALLDTSEQVDADS